MPLSNGGNEKRAGYKVQCHEGGWSAREIGMRLEPATSLRTVRLRSGGWNGDSQGHREDRRCTETAFETAIETFSHRP